MCTNNQLRRKKICVTPQGVNDAQNVPKCPKMSQNCPRLAEKIFQDVFKVDA